VLGGVGFRRTQPAGLPSMLVVPMSYGLPGSMKSLAREV
jgi:hypothetical protein